MKIKLVNNLGDFKKLRNQWNALLEESFSNSIFLSWEWMYYWQITVGHKWKLYILLAYETDGALVGIAPLYIFEEKKLFFHYTFLRIINDQRHASRELDFIIKRGKEERCLYAFYNYLKNNKKDWDILFLFGILQKSPSIIFWKNLKKNKKILYREKKGKYSLVDLSNWDLYVKKLKPRMRTKVRSVLKKYNELNDGRKISFSITETKDDLKRQIESFISLHQKRWNGVGQVGMFSAPGAKDFFSKALYSLFEKQNLMFFHLEYNHEYVAHQFCLFHKGVVHLSNEAFDVSIKDFDAGNMLRAKVFEYLSKNKIYTYDFLNNFSQHKANWGAVMHNQKNLEISHKSIKNYYYFVFYYFREKIKNFLMRVLPNFIIEAKRKSHRYFSDKMIYLKFKYGKKN